MTNTEAQNLISRNRSVFQYDPEMLEALDLAIRALIIQSTFEYDEREERRGAEWGI